MYVKPAVVTMNHSGVKEEVQLKVRDPQLRDLLPDEGREVPESAYWLRRLRDGDVVKATAPPPPPPPPPPAPAPSDSDPGDAAVESAG